MGEGRLPKCQSMQIARAFADAWPPRLGREMLTRGQISQHDCAIRAILQAILRTCETVGGHCYADLLSESFRASSRQAIRLSSANGLRRNPNAPACKARARAFSSKWAVMKMIGVR